MDRAMVGRYTQGALRREESLCCPVEYDPHLLAALPAEIVERDYGCGNPCAHVRSGDVVLDLGSGSGKGCYMAAQVVGRAGWVTGIDFNEEMLALARRHRPEIAQRIGYDNVSFHRARIQDLQTDLEEVDAYLRGHPIGSLTDLSEFEAFVREQRRTHPLVTDESVDVVVSNCVLNLVEDADKRTLFREIFRVLRRGGRAVISDIVADEPVPVALKEDPELWSGCVSGALQEQAFLDGFAAAGFYGIEILSRADKPWRTIQGIEFRAITIRAWKGKEGPCWDYNQAVIYRGPWSEVRDDDGHAFTRGVPIAVCEKTFQLYAREPYARDIIPVEPHMPVTRETARAFDCARNAVRQPCETKGIDYRLTTEAQGSACASDKECC